MNPWRGLRGLPKEMWILAFATLVNRAGTMVLPFLVLYLTRTFHVTPAQAASALTLYGIGALLVMPIAGRLTDRVGPLPVMKASLLLSGILLWIFPLAHYFAAILTVTFVLAVVNESVRPPSLAIVSDLVPPSQRKATFALSRLAINLGMSVGPALGGVLALFSFRWLFLVDGATSILAGLWLILAPWPRHATGLPRKAGEKQGWESAEDPEDIGRELEMESTAPLAPSHPIADLSAFRNMRMLYFLSAMIPVQLVFFQFTSTLPLFLVRDLHLPVSVFGSIFTLNTLMVVAIEVPLNTAMAGWSHRRTLALGALLYAIGFGSYAITTGPAGVFLGAAIWTFGEMVLMPGSAAYAAEIAPPGRRGEYMGLYTMSFNTAFSFGPFLSAEIFQRWGSHTLWSIAFISGTISAMLMSRIGTKKQPE